MTEQILLKEEELNSIERFWHTDTDDKIPLMPEVALHSVSVIKDVPTLSRSGRLLNYVLNQIKKNFVKANEKPHPFSLFSTSKTHINLPKTEADLNNAIKAQILRFDSFENSVTSQVAQEVANVVSEYFFTDDPEKNKLGVKKLKKNPFFDYVALLGNHTCVIQTKKFLGSGSYKKVYEGLQISLLPNSKSVSKIEFAPVAVLRVAQKTSAYTTSIQQAIREDTLAKEFSSSHIIKPSRFSFNGADVGMREEWIMISDKYSFSLDAVYKNKITQTFAQVLRALKGAAKGLAQMHLRGYIHRDIKPANIAVSAEGKGVLIDLGFIHKLDQLALSARGTPYYTAPEVVKKNERIANTQTPAADLWAYGISLYQMCHPANKRPPFLKSGQSPTEVYKTLDKLKKIEPNKYRETLFEGWKAQTNEEHKLQDLIAKLLSIDPQKRGTAKELHASLKKIYKEAIT